MTHRILGTKNETARIIIFKESDWSIESNTVVSGSGAYEVDSLASGTKTVVAESNYGELLGYGNIGAILSPNCGITDNMIEEYEWNPNTSTHAPAVIYIAGTVYAIVYKNDVDNGILQIKTINIAADGNIGSIIDSDTISSDSFNTDAGVMKVSQAGGTGGDCILAIWNRRYDQVGDRHDLIIRTWRISQAGTINGEVDNLEMGTGGTYGVYAPCSLTRRSENAVAYAATAFNGGFNPYIYTFSIQTNGSISDAVLDSEVIDSTYNDGYYSQIIEVGYKLIVNYRLNGSNKNVFKSYNITDPQGVISYLHSKDMEKADAPVCMLDMTHMGFDGFVCSYTVGGRNKLVSYAVGGTGAFTGPVDTVYMDSGAGNGVHISSLGGNGIIGHWRSNTNYGYISTVTMDINGSFSEIINTKYTGRLLANWSFPFQVQGDNDGIYGIAFGGNDGDGYLQTYPITNVCI
jgi:hypothetical protein